MLKRIFYIGLTLIMLMSTLLFMMGANGMVCSNPDLDTDKNHEIVNEGDCIFYVLKECNYAYLYSFSEESTAEVISVPAYVQGYPVTCIGRLSMLNGFHVSGSDSLKKIYLPYTSEYDDVLETSFRERLEEIVYTDFKKVYVKDETIVPELPYKNKKDYNPNYVFYFNYEDSPNDGVFWIDLVRENSLNLLPDTPTRQGYEFKGWYTEEECINAWDNVLTIPEEEIVCNFYAKWEQK